MKKTNITNIATNVTINIKVTKIEIKKPNVTGFYNYL